MRPLLPEDIDHVLTHAAPAFEQLAGSRILITGGTGFFGRWLIETLLHAESRWRSGFSATILSRDPDGFRTKFPHLATNPMLSWVRGGILELDSRLVGSQLGHTPAFDAVIHLVTDGDVAGMVQSPLPGIDVIAEGTRRALEFATAAKAKRFLFTSSGAVYGRQPADIPNIPETSPCAPDTMDLSTPYASGGNAKRFAELLCSAYAKSGGIQTTVARCFTFYGPHLPLDGKFAAGNFIADALAGRDLVIKGDGTPLRSYLHAADLTVWLWTLLARGASGRAYNVGSEHAISIRHLADQVKKTLASNSRLVVHGVADPARAPERYVPSTRRAAEELGLVERIPLEAGLARTLKWLS